MFGFLTFLTFEFPTFLRFGLSAFRILTITLWRLPFSDYYSLESPVYASSQPQPDRLNNNRHSRYSLYRYKTSHTFSDALNRTILSTSTTLNASIIDSKPLDFPLYITSYKFHKNNRPAIIYNFSNTTN